MTVLDDLLKRFEAIPAKERDQLKSQVLNATSGRKWFPNIGPQTTAYFCEADELFYGGQAGGGKSSLLCGMAYEEHQKTLLLRRYNKDAKILAEDELLGSILGGVRENWNGTDLRFRDGDKIIEFAGCENENDKQRFKGRPHDLIGFDEISDFLESQYVFITAWNRTTKRGQRCRVVCTGNPPTTADGLWVIKRWSAWLDPKHPNPAKPGELRWYVSNEDGDDEEVEGIGPHVIAGEDVFARSRTFIPSSLEDNPDLAADGNYKRILNSLPKELRDAYRDGRFDLGLKDNPWQLIPTAWIQEAMRRWQEYPPKGIPMCAVSLDPAQGGADDNVMAMRYDSWFAPLVKIPGKETPLGVSQAGLVVTVRKDQADVIVDCDGGYGGTVYKDLKDNGVTVKAYKGSEASNEKTADGTLAFGNKRAQAHWRLREALDPAQPGGSPIFLPDDSELLQDLSATRYEVRGGKIYVEDKIKIRSRIGRSPGKGDATVMCWSDGAKTATHYREWKKNRPIHSGGTPQVLMGRHANNRSVPRVVMGRR